MFFRSQKSLVLAVILIAIGGFKILQGSHYRGAVPREKTAVGTIVSIHRGRGGTSYIYKFRFNGVTGEDSSGVCKTPLTAAGCIEGAPVLVYYDRDDAGTNLLDEFGAAAREKTLFGIWMTGCGLLLIGLHFLFLKLMRSPDESEETDLDTDRNEPDNIHVVPEN